MNFINYKYFDRWTITQCKTFIQQNLITCLPKKRHVSLFLLEKHKIGKKKKDRLLATYVVTYVNF